MSKLLVKKKAGNGRIAHVTPDHKVPEIEQMLSVQHIIDLLAAKLSPSDYSL